MYARHITFTIALSLVCGSIKLKEQRLLLRTPPRFMDWKKSKSCENNEWELPVWASEGWMAEVQREYHWERESGKLAEDPWKLASIPCQPDSW